MLKANRRGSPSKRGKKRGRTSKAQDRADGRPNGLLSYPVETLQAIFVQLDHEGLDSLTRTCRGLRKLLLTPATGWIIYRSVFSALFAAGLPRPPRVLSLPAYASLLSLKWCGDCSIYVDHCKAYYSIVCFATRRRLCQDCYINQCATVSITSC